MRFNRLVATAIAGTFLITACGTGSESSDTTERTRNTAISSPFANMVVFVSGETTGGETKIYQYTFNAGTYTFNATNCGALVTLAYQYIPGPVEQSAIEIVALDMKQRDNIGVRSRSIAGETVSYTAGSLTVDSKQKLEPYRKRLPV